jgi:sporulation protein YhbH
MSNKYDDLSDIWKLKKRGKRDSDRHKKLVERAIRKHGRDIITENNIIKSDGNKKVKVPVRFLDKYRVKYGKLNKNQSVGQGLSGKKGSKYKSKSGQGQDPGSGGKAGDQEGERIFEAEILVSELVDILLEELNLPWMDPKNNTDIEVEKEVFSSVDKKGIFPNLDVKRTLIENIKRNAAKGDATVGSFVREDMRFKTWDNEKEYHSSAAVYLMMDRSGSMDKNRTYIAKSFYFWMVQFLKKRYKKIELIFIAHDTTAFQVDEQEFFSISSSGGTKCSSAFKLAYEHMKINHPKDKWNNYVFEFSDGDNWGEDNNLCVEYVEKMMPMVRAMGYGEIMLEDRKAWQNEDSLLSTLFNKKIKRTRFVSMQLNSKDDVFEALKMFFNIGDKSAKKDRE